MAEDKKKFVVKLEDLPFPTDERAAGEISKTIDESLVPGHDFYLMKGQEIIYELSGSHLQNVIDAKDDREMARIINELSVLIANYKVREYAFAPQLMPGEV